MVCYFSYKQLDYLKYIFYFILTSIYKQIFFLLFENKICYFEMLQIIDGHSGTTSDRMSMLYSYTSNVTYIKKYVFCLQICILYLVMNICVRSEI